VALGQLPVASYFQHRTDRPLPTDQDRAIDDFTLK
jgi:hypothetical protein